MTDIKNVLNDLWGANPEDLQSKASGKFGLNTGYLTKLEFNDKAGKEGTEGNAIDMTVTISDRDYYNRFFMNEDVYEKGGVLLKPDDEGYLKAFIDTYTQIGAVIKHALKAVGVTSEQIQASPKSSPETLKDLVPCFITDVKALLNLLPSGFDKKEIDVFLEYQWEIRKDNNKTYLVLPKNMKGGAFLCPTVKPVGKWTEVKSEGGLHYIDGAGNKHPFTKDENFMASNKANQQGMGSPVAQTNPIQAAQKSTWD